MNQDKLKEIKECKNCELCIEHDNISPMDSIDMSNLELYKSQSKRYKEAVRKIFFTCLRELDKDLVIEALKEKKFIEKDWNKDGNKYKEKKLKNRS